MLKQVQQTIKEQQLLSGKDKVVVAVSGGPDSVALLLAMLELYSPDRLLIAHVNYQARGTDSGKDEKFVRELADKLDLPCEVKRAKLDRQQAGFEAEARDIRYRFFEEIREKHQADKIAVAHTSDDLVETMLLHLLRGAGPRGLAGMAYQRDRIVRPLLDVTRADVEKFLAQKKQSFREDKSNQDTQYKRNWVRWRLLPYLRENVDSGIDRQLCQTANSFADVADWLEGTAQDTIKKLQITPSSFRLPEFLALPRVLQGEIIRQLLGKQDITRQHVTEVLAVLAKSESKKQKTFKGVTIEKQKDRFLVRY